jgi:hypothetical protein
MAICTSKCTMNIERCLESSTVYDLPVNALVVHPMAKVITNDPLVVLILTALVSPTATVYVIVGGPAVYWHVADTGLPSDVQALAVA